MSSVPSINAFVAVHAHQQDPIVQNQLNAVREIENVKNTNNSSKNLTTRQNSKKAWFGSIMDKISGLGHDGFGFSRIDEASNRDDKKLNSDDKNRFFSRMRHASSSSTASVDESSDKSQ